MKTRNAFMISVSLFFIYGCSHPIEIVGNGNVMSASGSRNCSLENFQAGHSKCTENLVVGEYSETYYAQPRDGWRFDHWRNYCTDAAGNECQFSIPASTVRGHWGETMLPLIAVFMEQPQYPYGLPDPLVSESGVRITSAGQWRSQRRPETLQLFASQIYGRTPTANIQAQYIDTEVDHNALEGTATRRQVRITLSNSRGAIAVDLLIYLPNNTSRPVPVFLGINFDGNHTINSDESWPAGEIVSRGYGLATFNYADVDPDFDDGFQNGVHPLFYAAGQSEPAADEWGSIGAWAWGLSRVLDYLLLDSDIDSNRVAVMGFSRLGKAALWAGAQDERFALVVSNESGLLGASLSRREGIASGKEPLSRLVDTYGYWFSRNLAQYAKNTDLLPVDQHQLIALIAPRPVYIASAIYDAWSDPLGEFEGGFYAKEVYKLLGTEGISAEHMPPLNTPVQSVIGYHIRSGDHGIKLYDWQRFLDFADIHLPAP